MERRRTVAGHVTRVHPNHGLRSLARQSHGPRNRGRQSLRDRPFRRVMVPAQPPSRFVP